MQPGQCWAFRGAQGYLVVQLAARIYPTAVSLEHIPKSLSPTGKIDSAPKDFSVWVSGTRVGPVFCEISLNVFYMSCRYACYGNVIADRHFEVDCACMNESEQLKTLV